MTSELKTGDILLVSSKSFIAKAIKHFQGSKWNHAGLVVEVWGELFIVESDKRGVQMTKVEHYVGNKKYELLRLDPTFAFDQKKLATTAVSFAGVVKYDYASLLFYQAVYQLSGKWIGRKGKKADDAFYCSEFVAYVYNEVVGIFPDWYKTSPSNILDYAMQSETFTVNQIQ